MDEILKLYKTVPMRLEIIELDIELKKSRGEDYKELLNIKRLLIEFEHRTEKLLRKLNEREFFYINLMYSLNITVTDLAVMLGKNRSTLANLKSRTLLKLEKMTQI